MALLSSHLQVHEGLILGLVRTLHATPKGSLGLDELGELLQPGLIEDRPELISMARDACIWFGLTTGEDPIALTQVGQGVAEDQTLRGLRAQIRKSLAVDGGKEEARQGDLARALAWLLAQDSWDMPASYESAGDSVEMRQKAQFPSGPEFVNKTKWTAVRRWALFLGLAESDPVSISRLVPDPTSAVTETLSSLPAQEWTAAAFESHLADACSTLDGGEARESLLSGLSQGELPWEHDKGVLSPSLSLAWIRLEYGGLLQLRQEDDAPLQDRRLLSLSGDSRVVDKVLLSKAST